MFQPTLKIFTSLSLYFLLLKAADQVHAGVRNLYLISIQSCRWVFHFCLIFSVSGFVFLFMIVAVCLRLVGIMGSPWFSVL